MNLQILKFQFLIKEEIVCDCGMILLTNNLLYNILCAVSTVIESRRMRWAGHVSK